MNDENNIANPVSAGNSVPASNSNQEDLYDPVPPVPKTAAEAEADFWREMDEIDKRLGVPQMQDQIAELQEAKRRAEMHRRNLKRLETKRGNAPLNIDSMPDHVLERYLRDYEKAPIEKFISDILLARDGHGHLIHQRGYKQVIAPQAAMKFLRYMKYRLEILRLGVSKKHTDRRLHLTARAENLYQTLPAYLQWRGPKSGYIRRHIDVAVNEATYARMEERRHETGAATMSAYLRRLIMQDLGIPDDTVIVAEDINP